MSRQSIRLFIPLGLSFLAVTLLIFLIANILDLALIGGRYLLTCGNPRFDERADINNDCVVNIQDLACAGGNYLKVSTTP